MQLTMTDEWDAQVAARYRDAVIACDTKNDALNEKITVKSSEILDRTAPKPKGMAQRRLDQRAANQAIRDELKE